MRVTTFSLAGGALTIQAPEPLVPLIGSSWLPRNSTRVADPHSSPASIRLLMGQRCNRVSSQRPTLRLGTASLWMLSHADSGVLGAAEGGYGTLNLPALRAALTIPAGSGPKAAFDVYSMLTVSAALLLGRSGRALVHAAAVVSPQGQAWLLTGDARAGKSTTSANLISRGWNYLSDDQVILRSEDGGIVVEGLPRPFHLDEGWGGEAPVHARRAVDAATLGPGRLLDAAPLGGLLFPRVRADQATRLEPVSPADAIAALVRQSPWLLADKIAAPRLLGLLRIACAGRRHRLSLGLDTFGNAELLEARLQDAVLAPAFSAARAANRASGQAATSAVA